MEPALAGATDEPESPGGAALADAGPAPEAGSEPAEPRVAELQAQLSRLTAELADERERRFDAEAVASEAECRYAMALALMRVAVGRDVAALQQELAALQQDLAAKTDLIAFMKRQLSQVITELRGRHRPKGVGTGPAVASPAVAAAAGDARDARDTVAALGVDLFGGESRFSALGASELVDKQLPAPDTVRKPEIRAMLTFLRDKGIDHMKLRSAEFVTVHKVIELARAHGWGWQPEPATAPPSEPERLELPPLAATATPAASLSPTLLP